MNLPIDEILQGDVRALLPTIPTESVDCIITSPPYWALRDYGADGQIGLEPTWRDDVADGKARAKWGNLGVHATDAEVRAELAAREEPRRDKTLDMTTISPAAGEGLRLPPERGEPGGPDEDGQYHPLGANPGDVWSIPSQRLEEAHFATFPEELVRRLLLSGCPARTCAACGAPWRPTNTKAATGKIRTDGGERHIPGMEDVDRSEWQEDVTYTPGPPTPSCGCLGESWMPGLALDPFMGSGTTGLVAKTHGRDFLGCELNSDYLAIARRRISPVMNQRLNLEAGSA